MQRIFGARSSNNSKVSNSISLDNLSEPESIIAVFRGDYNILLTHQKVLDKFQRLEASLPDKQLRLQRLRSIVHNSLAEQRKSALEIITLQKTVNELENHSDSSLYHKQTVELLQEYQSLTTTNSNRTFGIKRQVDEHTAKRELVIQRYLTIARRYIDINVILDVSDESCCPICLESLEGSNGARACKKCPIFVPDFESEVCYKDGERSNLVVKSTNYAKFDHLHDAIIKFQGKQPNKLPSELVEEIRSTIQAYGIDPKDLGIDTLYQILKDKKYSIYYDDVYLFYHLITQKELPNLEDIQGELFRDASLFTSIYHEIKPKNRSNCLNAHFVRDVLLRRRGREFPGWQCTTLRTALVQTIHNEVMEKAFKRLGWGEFAPW